MNEDTEPPDGSEISVDETPTEKQLNAIQEDHIAAANEERMHVLSRQEIDKFEGKIPFGWFKVSGRNASTLYLSIGAAMVILALGVAIANIIGALK